jgi:cytochrome c-type biogenesis protein
VRRADRNSDAPRASVRAEGAHDWQDDDVIADLVQRGLQEWWGPGLAFAAGVVSFASPCVLPLVPGYLSFVAGERAAERGAGDPADPGSNRPPVGPILLFILGFSAVFTVVGGFTASSVGRWLKSPTGERVAGGVVLAFGVFMLLYAMRFGSVWLYREGRPLLARVRPGPAAAFPLGAAFAVGWTPCIGPVLGGILTLAAAQGTTVRAVTLLLFYSFGLGLPFLLVGLGVGKLMGAFRFFSRHYRWFAGASGVVLVIVGSLLVAGMWTRLVAPLFRFANRIGLPI